MKTALSSLSGMLQERKLHFETLCLQAGIFSLQFKYLPQCTRFQAEESPPLPVIKLLRKRTLTQRPPGSPRDLWGHQQSHKVAPHMTVPFWDPCGPNKQTVHLAFYSFIFFLVVVVYVAYLKGSYRKRGRELPSTVSLLK